MGPTVPRPDIPNVVITFQCSVYMSTARTRVTPAKRHTFSDRKMSGINRAVARLRRAVIP